MPDPIDPTKTAEVPPSAKSAAEVNALWASQKEAPVPTIPPVTIPPSPWLAGIVNSLPPGVKTALAAAGIAGTLAAIVVTTIGSAGIALPAWAIAIGVGGGGIAGLVSSVGLISEGAAKKGG